MPSHVGNENVSGVPSTVPSPFSILYLTRPSCTDVPSSGSCARPAAAGLSSGSAREKLRASPHGAVDT